jgi:hypothetical protein
MNNESLHSEDLRKEIREVGRRLQRRIYLVGSIQLFLLLLFVLLIVHNLPAQTLPPTRFEQSNGAETPTYAEAMAYFRLLDKTFPTIQMQPMGLTDSGEPLHLLTLSADRNFDLDAQRKRGKAILLINNAIHPGEPDGVDASLRLVRDLAAGTSVRGTNGAKLPDNVVLCVVPFYNIGGALNRNRYSRANQNGPAEYGFRGNARNYDLNRDFVKCDTRNARAFAELFHRVDPDVFVDTHVSNGADYQHVMTLISTQPDKLGGELGRFQRGTFEPYLYAEMDQRGFPMIPYVTNFGPKLAEKGMDGFVDAPRYSTGYAALFQTFGFMPETHMLKPYPQRVEATYQLLRIFLDFTGTHASELRRLRQQAREAVKTQTEFALGWQKDTSRFDRVPFQAYAAKVQPSEVSGQPRLYYDRAEPLNLDVRYFNYFNPTNVVQKPTAYLIPQGWHSVIDLLKLNGVRLERLPADEEIEVDVYWIEDYKSYPRPYEGHYLHYDVKTSTQRQKIRFRKGDYRIPCDQATNRYLVEVLEPTSPDGFFAWNFFDTILQAKEGYSDYVFEDLAAALLKRDPALREKLEKRRAEDPAFAKNGRAQLEFVYQNSPWAEPEYRRYPVFRVEK